MTALRSLAAIAPPGRGARLALAAGTLVIAALAIGFVVWWLLVRPQAARRAAAQAQVEARLSGAAAATATQAIGEMVVHDRDVTTIHEITRRGEDAVHAAAGADVRSPDVAAALGAALCGMRTYQSEPDCTAVPADRRGVGPALRDLRSFTPGR